MRQIISYITIYLRENFNGLYFILIAAFLALSLALNYTVGLENLIETHCHSWPTLFSVYCLFYLVPFAFSIGAYRLCYGSQDFIHSPRFWGLSAFMILILALDSSFLLDNSAVAKQVIDMDTPVLLQSLNNLKQAFIWFFPAFLYWLIFDRKRTGLYGFRTRGFPLYPYLLMLLLMAPAVLWASFQPDFLTTYPRYPLAGQVGADTSFMSLLAFELCYGLAFVSVEFFFRGFMIGTLSRRMGPAIIMPMAVVYCFIHFQKPLLEATSSILGGLILGIISCYGGSIIGGVIAHLGMAWMMEAAAFVQIYIIK